MRCLLKGERRRKVSEATGGPWLCPNRRWNFAIAKMSAEPPDDRAGAPAQSTGASERLARSSAKTIGWEDWRSGLCTLRPQRQHQQKPSQPVTLVTPGPTGPGRSRPVPAGPGRSPPIPARPPPPVPARASPHARPRVAPLLSTGPLSHQPASWSPVRRG